MLQTTKQEQIQEWSRLYGKTISDEEYKGICDNLNKFFSTLKQWSDDDERMLKENGQNNDQISDVLPSATN